jgi:hypothetical protein
MWFTLYLHITVRWVGTATPSRNMHPARHMARFDELFETVEEFRCYSQHDAALVIRQTESIYCGPNRITTIQSVNEGKCREIEARICNACMPEALTTTQCGQCGGNKWIAFRGAEVRS